MQSTFPPVCLDLAGFKAVGVIDVKTECHNFEKLECSQGTSVLKFFRWGEVKPLSGKVPDREARDPLVFGKLMQLQRTETAWLPMAPTSTASCKKQREV